MVKNTNQHGDLIKQTIASISYGALNMRQMANICCRLMEEIVNYYLFHMDTLYLPAFFLIYILKDLCFQHYCAEVFCKLEFRSVS